MESEVTVEVHGDRIVVKLPGTEFAVSYHRTDVGISQSPVMAINHCAFVPRDKFETIAWEAALRKAQELGWIIP